jgi:predicted metal-dependent hydrolase
MDAKNDAKKSGSLERLQLGEQVIEYQLIFADRKTLGISVHPNAQVTVRSPKGLGRATVQEMVHQRAAWILRKQGEMAQREPKPSPRQHVNGETHRYLGHAYRLTVVQSMQPMVQLEENALVVATPDPADQPRTARYLEEWYREQAQRLFLQRMLLNWTRFASYNVTLPNLAIRKMKARWGSCSTKGIITLNLKLMQAPLPCIDYVIVHELCHLIEHNHSKQFYALLAHMLPDWAERRKQLNEFPVA